MVDKSYVTMEQKVCLVCAKTFDSGAILMDTRLRERFERYTITGWDLCPDDQAKYAEGYIALVEARGSAGTATMQPDEAFRLGRIAHVREAAFNRMFNVPGPEEGSRRPPMVFIDSEVMDMLEAKVAADAG